MTATFEIDGLGLDAWRRLANEKWSLCLGAGINGHLMPDWFELARHVVNRSNGEAFDPGQFKSLVEASRWSLDAWIQQSLNRNIADGQSPTEFNEHLREALYSNFLSQADGANLREEATTFLNNPQRIRKGKFDNFASFLESRYKDTTVYRLAQVFTQLDPERMPTAVLNFNADTFFQSIVFLLKKKMHLNKTGVWEDVPETFSRIVRSSDASVGSRIPIYHLHGCMLPQSSVRRKMSDTPAGMVFPENSYANMAGRMFSWGQSIFLYHAQADSLCFVGMSMADPNIRRWLSWTFEGYSADLQPVAQLADLSGRHIWLTTRPKKSRDPRLRLYPQALRHLGVQICWIPNWSHGADALKNLLGIRT